MRVLIVDTDPEHGTRVLEVTSIEVAKRLVQKDDIPEVSAGVLARGASWSAYCAPGDDRTIVILEVP